RERRAAGEGGALVLVGAVATGCRLTPARPRSGVVARRWRRARRARALGGGGRRARARDPGAEGRGRVGGLGRPVAHRPARFRGYRQDRPAEPPRGGGSSGGPATPAPAGGTSRRRGAGGGRLGGAARGPAPARYVDARRAVARRARSVRVLGRSQGDPD